MDDAHRTPRDGAQAGTAGLPELPPGGAWAGLPGEAQPLGPPLVAAPEPVAGRLAEALAAAGWVRKGSRWARFGGGTASSLDLLSPAGLGLPASAFDRLVRDGLDLVDELWLRALAAPPQGPPVPAAHRAAAHRRVAADSGAWLRAQARAGADGPRVSLLQDAYDTGLPLGVRARTRDGGWTGATVALSGLDGAGKSTQGHLLAAALHALGYDVAVEWSRIGFSPVLERLVGPAKGLARRVRGEAAAPALEVAEELGARRVVRRHPAVDGAWAVLVAGAEAADVRARQARHAAAGRVVVRDRYLLDSVVHLADRYGEQPGTAAARALLRSALPPATTAFLLELPAEVAHRRKPGEWALADLQRHATAYARAADELGVRRLDARQEPHALAALVAEAVWRGLP